MDSDGSMSMSMAQYRDSSTGTCSIRERPPAPPWTRLPARTASVRTMLVGSPLPLSAGENAEMEEPWGIPRSLALTALSPGGDAPPCPCCVASRPRVEIWGTERETPKAPTPPHPRRRAFPDPVSLKLFSVERLCRSAPADEVALRPRRH